MRKLNKRELFNDHSNKLFVQQTPEVLEKNIFGISAKLDHQKTRILDRGQSMNYICNLQFIKTRAFRSELYNFRQSMIFCPMTAMSEWHKMKMISAKFWFESVRLFMQRTKCYKFTNRRQQEIQSIIITLMAFARLAKPTHIFTVSIFYCRFLNIVYEEK